MLSIVESIKIYSFPQKSNTTCKCSANSLAVRKKSDDPKDWSISVLKKWEPISSTPSCSLMFYHGENSTFTIQAIVSPFPAGNISCIFRSVDSYIFFIIYWKSIFKTGLWDINITFYPFYAWTFEKYQLLLPHHHHLTGHVEHYSRYPKRWLMF